MLVWNPTDFLQCLEVEPVVDDNEISHLYILERDGIRLTLTVFQYDGDVYITLDRAGANRPIFDMKLLRCAGARYVRDQRGEYLEFAPAKCFGKRYDGESPIPYGVRVAVRPSISITLF